MVPAPRPIVVKLGGSLVRGGRHGGALAVLAAAAGPLVLVPGGGAFADAVREQQRIEAFSDGLAHRLALRAMGMTGAILAEANPDRFEIAVSADDIADVLGRGRIAVWSPEAMVTAAPAIAETWDITSDSLALWLGGELGAKAVILLKSADAPAAVAAAEDLAASGLVDAAFPSVAAATGVPVRLIGPRDQARLAAGLAGAAIGTLVAVDSGTKARSLASLEHLLK